MNIACWSGPRNISTAMMRSWSSRKDTFVTDEPLYAYYLQKSLIEHPLKNKIIDKYPTNIEKIKKYLINDNPKNKEVWYQKHMAHHILDFKELDFILSFKNAFLIRHPGLVINSFTKKNILSNSIQLGYKQQKNIIDYLIKNNKEFVVIDTNIFLKNPEKILKKWCKKINLNFDDRMLHWKKGIYKTDGIWASHWYNSVVNSNSFFGDIDNNFKVKKQYESIFDECFEYYEEILKYKI
jgi:hypothetical protein